MTDDADASLVYAGSAGRVGRIALVNTFLALITIGVYRFWGKTRLRQYLWGAVRFQGDSLEYTGRPIELFLGFLIAIGVLFPFGVLFGALDFYVDRPGRGPRSGDRHRLSSCPLLPSRFRHIPCAPLSSDPYPLARHPRGPDRRGFPLRRPVARLSSSQPDDVGLDRALAKHAPATIPDGQYLDWEPPVPVRCRGGAVVPQMAVLLGALSPDSGTILFLVPRRPRPAILPSIPRSRNYASHCP